MNEAGVMELFVSSVEAVQWADNKAVWPAASGECVGQLSECQLLQQQGDVAC